MSQNTAQSGSKPWILFAALILGVVLGALAHPFRDAEWLQILNGTVLHSIGQIFLRLIFMVVVPLIFSALVLGTLELARGSGVGRIAGKTLFFTLLASSASVLVGVGLVQLFKPGVGFPMDPTALADKAAEVGKLQNNASQAKGAVAALLDLIPKNPLDAAVNALNGEMIALMVFALIFGIAFASVLRERGATEPAPLERVLEDIMAASMKVVGVAMKLAPLAVFAMIFQNISKLGLGMLWNLGAYSGLVILGLLIQQFGVYTLLLKLFTRRSPLAFYSSCREAYLYAFSTASSNATLPTALATAEGRLQIPPHISRFVLTVGASANQNGTALFEGITVLFLAQVYGVQLDFLQQCQVVAMSILAGIGTAGVPGGSLPLIVILLQNLGIPAEGMGLILGVDRFLDMARTTLNVSGDLVIAALVSGEEGQEPSS